MNGSLSLSMSEYAKLGEFHLGGYSNRLQSGIPFVPNIAHCVSNLAVIVNPTPLCIFPPPEILNFSISPQIPSFFRFFVFSFFPPFNFHSASTALTSAASAASAGRSSSSYKKHRKQKEKIFCSNI